MDKKEKARIRAAAWKKANPERAKAYTKQYESNREPIRARVRARYAANRDSFRAKSVEYYKNNKERILLLERKRRALKGVGRSNYQKYRERSLQKAKEWARKNKDKRAAYQRAREARKVGAQPSWRNDFFISEAYSLARLRTEITGIRWSVDHIVPLKSHIVCGLHVENNLQVIPSSVNTSKYNRYWPDMP